MKQKPEIVQRSGGSLEICTCPTCEARHVRGKKKEKEGGVNE